MPQLEKLKLNSFAMIYFHRVHSPKNLISSEIRKKLNSAIQGLPLFTSKLEQYETTEGEERERKPPSKNDKVLCLTFG